MNKERQHKLEHFFIFFCTTQFYRYLYFYVYCWYLFPVLNPFLANIPIPYLPKTPKNRILFGFFQGV